MGFNIGRRLSKQKGSEIHKVIKGHLRMGGLKVLTLVLVGMGVFLLEGYFTRSFAMDESSNRLVVVYDNYALDRDLTPAWGFSCLIVLAKQSILFDTGGGPAILLGNMERLNIDPRNIGIVVLSHVHWDHTGGLGGFLRRNSDAVVYVPESFPVEFKKELGLVGATVEEVGKNPMVVYPGVQSTGELGLGIKEQSLVIETKKGLVIITGCAHPGIVNIVKQSKRLFDKDIHLVLGGFHLMGSPKKELNQIMDELDSLGVEKLAPCHCSGDGARAAFRQRYRQGYIACGAGLVLELPELVGP